MIKAQKLLGIRPHVHVSYSTSLGIYSAAIATAIKMAEACNCVQFSYSYERNTFTVWFRCTSEKQRFLDKWFAGV